MAFRLVFLGWILCATPLLAQTDHFYMVTTPTPAEGRKVTALAINSRSIRELPTSPYPLERGEDDGYLLYHGSVAFTDPGPFLYVYRHNPVQIYGYKREVDGQLNLLPGFPMTFLNPKGTLQGGIWYMLKHPYLPVLYTADYGWDRIRAFRVEANGMLNELPGSPYVVWPTIAGMHSMAICPDGRFGFVTSYEPAPVTGDSSLIFRGVSSISMDPKSGAIQSFNREVISDTPPLGLALTDDGRYLYITNFNRGEIRSYAVKGAQLTELSSSPFKVPMDPVFLWTKGSVLALGGDESQSVALCSIQNDGSLVLSPGSPVRVHSANNIYAAFSPRGDRILFGGNSFVVAFDITSDHRLIPIPGTPFPLQGISWGVSAAPEMRGDPFSLRFDPAPRLGDSQIFVVGDANTPFYLRRDDECLGPFTTDDQGLFDLPIPVIGPDTLITLHAYCDESANADFAATVPTLFPGMLMVLVLGMFSCCLYYFDHQQSRCL